MGKILIGRNAKKKDMYALVDIGNASMIKLGKNDNTTVAVLVKFVLPYNITLAI